MIRFEMTDFGNIHLYAKIDGQERRRIFTKKNEQYETVLEAMRKRLSIKEQEEILKLFYSGSAGSPEQRAISPFSSIKGR